MKIGDKIIYGNEIECIFKNYKITSSGEVIIYANCKGGTIIAPWEMFKKAQPKRSRVERQPRTGRRGSDDGRPHNERMIDYMTIYKTTDYFNITKEEASKICNGYDTREEAKVLDSGLEHFFFETLECLTEEYNSKERKEYTEKKGYEVILFEFVADNGNHNKYCMVFRQEG